MKEVLNSKQQEAVLYNEGPLMILAGAGSGKTRTIIHKINYLIENGIPPHQILALTFSNRTASEMFNRMHKAPAKIYTFHAFCSYILRIHFLKVDLKDHFAIYDEGDSIQLVKKIVRLADPDINYYDIWNYINALDNYGYYEDSEPPAKIFDNDKHSFYHKYKENLKASNAIDFGGLLTRTLKLFNDYPNITNFYQNLFKYILVDEYQDTNRAQFELLKNIATHQNICVVGDEDQSIYSWRGANLDNINQFKNIFPQFKLIKLEQNYRSTKVIINAANAVIKNNLMRTEKNLWTDNENGNQITVISAFTDKEEAIAIADKILNLNSNFSDIAILYRANYQSRIIEDALRLRKISYRVIGGIKFYDRKEIKDILSFIRFLYNKSDNQSLLRIINIPPRGIGSTTIRRLESEAIDSGSSIWEIITRSNNKALKNFIDLISSLEVLTTISPVAAFQQLLDQIDYTNYLKRTDQDYVNRLENISELANAIYDFELKNKTAVLADFLQMISLDSTHHEDTQGEVSLMTLHSAKGLEFPYVFISGLEEDTFPYYKCFSEPDGLEEERRLFYVGMTRAKKQLFLSYSLSRFSFGRINYLSHSRFLDEIPSEFLVSSKPNYMVGKKILHNIYGVGKITDMTESDGEEFMEVVFQNGHTRNFSVADINFPIL